MLIIYNHQHFAIISSIVEPASSAFSISTNKLIPLHTFCTSSNSLLPKRSAFEMSNHPSSAPAPESTPPVPRFWSLSLSNISENLSCLESNGILRWQPHRIPVPRFEGHV